MADVKVSKQTGEKEQQIQRREEGRGVARRGAELVPSLFSMSPREFFSLSPFSLMRRITEDMDRTFSGFLGFRPYGAEPGLWAPPIEVYEEAGNLKVCAELPGINKDDIKVEVAEHQLVIRGERKQEREEEREGIYRTERTYGRFYRSIPLPEGAQIDNASADFKNGVLEIAIPIPESSRKAREIPIRAAAQEAEAKKPQAA